MKTGEIGKMKVGILTFHNAHNYGATLQAYALKTCVQQLGYEVEIINYRNKTIEESYPQKLYPKFTRKELNPRRWKQFIYDTVRGIYGQKQWQEQWRSFDDFISQILLEGKSELIGEKDFEELNKDIYLLGSDQIWSSFLTGIPDPVYFGAFRTKEKIISYAASLANGKVEEKEENIFKNLLENVDVISVREEKLAKQLETITGRNVTTTIDPTLLLEAKDYENILARIEDKKKRKLLERTQKKYIFAYFVVEEQPVADCAKKLAELTGLEIIELHYYHMPECSRDNQYADMGPAEFLFFIKHAEYVVTNSFHGTVFSVLYQRQFYSVYKKNGRVDNLLAFLDISNRHISHAEDVVTDQVIEYDEVHRRLQEYKQKSIKFLRDNLAEE